MKQLEGHWKNYSRGDLQHTGTIPEPRPQCPDPVGLLFIHFDIIWAGSKV